MPSDRAYITVLGRSTWAMVNCYQAALRQQNYLPRVIHIFTEKRYEQYAPKGMEAFEVLSDAFGIKPEMHLHVVGDVDFMAAGKQMSKLMRDLRQAGMEIAVDITPGRKALVVGALIPAIKQDLDHIFYLEITDLSDASRPFMEIPLRQQKLWDMSPGKVTGQ